MPVKEDDEVLHLDQTLLLDLLDGIKPAGSVPAVRRATADLKQRVLAGKADLPVSSGAPVMFGRE